MSAEPGFQQLLPMREAGRLAGRRPGLAESGGGGPTLKHSLQVPPKNKTEGP